MKQHGIDNSILHKLGLEAINFGSHNGLNRFGSDKLGVFENVSPVDGKSMPKVYKSSKVDFERVVQESHEAYLSWRKVPAPKRGEIVRQLGEAFRANKQELGALVSYEMGKSLQEGLGEVQEMIDIAEFAVGLSRQLYGLTMHSERPSHRMYEQWHPLGVVGVISAFNFPVAVWSWNSFISLVCGNATIWKPSEKTPLSALACMNIASHVLKANKVPSGVLSCVIGDVQEVGEPFISCEKIPLVSATGSTRMGKRVAEIVGRRLGRSLLELGGNNAIILTEHTDLKLAIPAVVFGAVGTCGQRCTTTRRLIVHESMYSKVIDSLKKAYSTLKIGNPLDESNHVGPLIDQAAVASMQAAIKQAKTEGARLVYGGEVLSDFASGCYVRPAIVECDQQTQIVREETFAPILYVMKYKGALSEAIHLQNDVKQGLSSSIFTENMRQAEEFLSCRGSDCGIANVNIGTSGAEIGGAFGGEKETGGGRESGSDSWKAYMRRQTNTINYSDVLPLAQGIKFDL